MVRVNSLYRLILVVRFTSDFIDHIQHFDKFLIDNHRQCFCELINDLVTALYSCNSYIFINNLLKLIKVYINMLAMIMHFKILCEVYCKLIIFIYNDSF